MPASKRTIAAVVAGLKDTFRRGVAEQRLAEEPIVSSFRNWMETKDWRQPQLASGMPNVLHPSRLHPERRKRLQTFRASMKQAFKAAEEELRAMQAAGDAELSSPRKRRKAAIASHVPPTDPPVMGSRVRVFWLVECKWFHGSVDATAVQDGEPIFHVVYNDGEDGWVSAFGDDTWHFVDAASAAAAAADAARVATAAADAIAEDDELDDEPSSGPLAEGMQLFRIASHWQAAALTDPVGFVGRRISLPMDCIPDRHGADVGSTRGIVEGYVDALPSELGEPSPAYIVRAISDDAHYAIPVDSLLPCMPQSLQRRHELATEARRLQALLDGGFSEPQPTAPKPDLRRYSNRSVDPLYAQIRQLLKAMWISQLTGQRWEGSDDELESQWQSETRRHNGARRVSERRNNPGQQQRHGDSEASRRCADRRHPAGFKLARNAEALCGCEEHAHSMAEAVDVGTLGACALCSDTDPCVQPDDDDHKRHRYLCTHCGALLFPGEALRATADPATTKFKTKWRGRSCCSDGAVALEPVQRDPEVEKLWADEAQRKLLLKHTHKLNNGLALASAKVKEPTKLPGQSSWRPSVVIQGKLYHRIGPLTTQEGATPQFAQLYVHDPAESDEDQAARRYQHMRFPASTSANEARQVKTLLAELQAALCACNGYVQDFLTAAEIYEKEEITNAQFVINPDARPGTAHTHQYNAPSGRRQQFSEVSVLLSEAEVPNRSVQLRHRDGGLYSIDETSRAFDPLHFVLLFPCGDDGWRIHMPRAPHPLLPVPEDDVVMGEAEGGQPEGRDGDVGDADDAEQRSGRRQQVSLCEFYAHRLQLRELIVADESGSQLHTADGRPQPALDADGQPRLDDALSRAGRLFQEYCCMALAKQETQRLRYLDTHQAEIRAELYQNLADAWKEIRCALRRGEMAHDRPDLLSRVFKLKLDALLKELYKDGIFGRTIAHLHMIEFQKRGLPHTHILIILQQDDRLHSPSDIDACVCAELPEEPTRDAFATDAEYDEAYQRYLRLAELVAECMTHNECGPNQPNAVCMDDGVCAKRFPKDFCDATVYNECEIYPQYRRRAPSRGGATFTFKDCVIDNSWVVPYSPYLLLKYECHLNVEVCVSVESVKYLYKYVYKGPDRSMVAVCEEGAPTNEIELYQDVRSLGAVEGCWRTFKFDMYGKDPPVARLPVHLANMQRCQYVAGSERQAVEQGAPATELTAWLDYIREHTDDASRNVTYPHFVETHKYTKKSKRWDAHKQQRLGERIIGRVYTIHPSAGEVFYLRTLLHHIEGRELALTDAAEAEQAADAFTFEAFKYVGGTKHESYQAVCEARGLLADDKEWFEVLDAAHFEKMAKTIRELYIYIAHFNEPCDPAKLFDEFWPAMAEDFERQLKDRHIVFDEPMETTLCAMVLLDIKQRLESHSETIEKHHLSITEEEQALAECAMGAVVWSKEPKEILDELTPPNEREELENEFNARHTTLRTSQREVVDAVTWAIDNDKSRLIFIDAPGGTGKTYCENAMLMHVRSKGEVALAVASSGIAAILLKLGRTFHSRFKASLKPSKGQPLNISAQTKLAELVRRAKLIVWDEAPMMHLFQLDALDLTLRDLMKTVDPKLEHVPFGGKVVVVAGDFRQTLPVLKKASRAQILDAALTHSELWGKFEIFALTDNMRVEKEVERGGDRTQLEAFAVWLLRVGNGDLEADENQMIELPSELCMEEGADVAALVDWVFPNLAEHCQRGDSAWLAERAILAPLNSQVDDINDKVTERFPSEKEWMCLSADETADADDATTFPTELLNTFEASGMPKHELKLKKFMPVMLLRNINPRAGLCNGTRLLVLDVMCNGKLLKAMILSDGDHQGDEVYIPRITLLSGGGHIPL